MPNIKSSKKDVLSSKIAYEKNKANKSALKTSLKKFENEYRSRLKDFLGQLMDQVSVSNNYDEEHAPQAENKQQA